MKVPTVKSPLSIIALFVALIELFLAYPVTQLGGNERLIMVIFMTAFPFFVASAFFFILWHRPINLYSPNEITPGLENRYMSAVGKTAFEVRIAELEQENQQLGERATRYEASVLTQTAANRLSEEINRSPQADIEALETEVRARLQPDELADDFVIEKTKRDIQQKRLERKLQRSERVQEEMSRFRDWLAGRGFENLPDIPEVVIEPANYLNAYSDFNDNTAHFGASISNDLDTIAHTYFHNVLHSLDVLNEFTGETAAIVEGLCDYYACSYNDDPYLGESFAKAAGLKSGWIRNLQQVVRLNEVENEPHAMSLVWSGACWELRQRYGSQIIDTAIRDILAKMRTDSTISQAAFLLQNELAAMLNEQAKEEVRKIFEKRRIAFPD